LAASALLAFPVIAAAQNFGDALKGLGDKAKQAAQDAAKDAEKKANDAMKKVDPTVAKAPDAAAPLPTDPRLVTGTLANGLSYIVVKHPNPPGRAVMWIHIATGSLNETDSQRGIAHYLEHMAFNGSENFAPGSVVDFFQSMGLSFGRDQNAFTSFDQTTYQLTFPDVKPETLEKGMRFFADVAGRLALLPEEIEKERQIILEEKRTRAGGRQRIQDYVLERLVPGSLIGVRLPIGTDATLNSVLRPDFMDYYGKYYVPGNMTMVVVADTDTREVIDQITKSFGTLEKKPVPAGQDPRVTPTSGVRAIVASDKELTQASVEMTRIWPKRPPTTTVGGMREDLVRHMGVMAFNRRIGAKLEKGGTSYLRANASATQMFKAAFSTTVDCDGEPAKWKDMVAELGTDLQRARLHGFSTRELDDVRKEIISGAERQLEREPTQRADMLIRRLNTDIANGDTITSASQELDLVKQLLPTITAEEIAKAFAENFDFKNVVYVCEFPSSMEGGVPSESDVIAAGTKALDVKPEAEKEGVRAAALLDKVPTAGTVVAQDEHAATKVSSAWLSNGTRVHYRFMDEQKNEATISITLAGGSIEETPADRGVGELASVAWGQPATSKLSSTDIRDLTTGRKARARGGVGLDAMSITVAGSPADLESAMQQAYLMLTDPVIEKSGYERWKTRSLRTAEERKKVVDGVYGETLAATLFPAGEVRVLPLTPEQINAQTIEKSQAWLRARLATAPIEVSIVGDIQKDEAMRLVSTYIGSLPKRERIGETTLASLRTLKRPTGPRAVEKTVETETDKARALVGFYACDQNQVNDRRNLSFASQVISTRMLKLIREEQQLAYSPRAGLRPGQEFPGFGMFALDTTTNPSKAGRLLEVTWKVFDEFAKDGPTEEEMGVVKKQIANTLDTEMRRPAYWTNQTSDLTYRGNNLDNVVTVGEYYKNLGAADVKATFAKYYKPESKFSVVVKPTGGEGAKPDSAEGEKKVEKPGN
jgi:zinc protease